MPETLLPFLPNDEFDRRHLDQVHPPDWTNPTPRPRYHLVVLGAGTAGLVAAAGAAGLGAKVALVERHWMGGDCLNVGCVPSKAILRAARAWHAGRDGQRFGAPPPSEKPGDFGLAMRRMRELRAGISPVDGAPRFSALGVDVFFGSGAFVSREAVQVRAANGDLSRLRFRRAVIATGGRPAAPPIAGLDEVGYRTNETIFSLTELPRRLAVVGGGPIGCELAQAFARFGSEVTLLQSAARLLAREDPDASEIVAAALRRDGVRIEFGATVRRAERVGEARQLHFDVDSRSETVEIDEILIAAGREPNVEGLGLDLAGVRTNATGIEVDDRLRTANRAIFAAGDVCSRLQFTHNSDAQARIVLANALFPGRARTSSLVVPRATYTSPEVAQVGLTAAEAGEQGIDVDVIDQSMHEVDRAILDGEPEGFLRLLVRRGSDRVVGATLVAEHAGDMASALCLTIAQGIGLERIAATIHPYPTQGEALKKAADAWRRTRLTPAVKRLLAFWFRVT